MSTRSATKPSVLEIQQVIEEAITKNLVPLSQNILALTSQLVALEKKLFERDTRISTLENTVAKLQETVSTLASDHDALEQYGRRMNFRVENVEYQEGETTESLQEQVVTILRGAGSSIRSEDVVLLHRTSALRFRENVSRGGGESPRVKSSQVIVRVAKWRVRENIHLQQNEARAAGHPVKQDLSQRRRELITAAIEAIKGWPEQETPVYAYANINCVPTIRRGRETRKFTSDDELQSALAHFQS